MSPKIGCLEERIGCCRRIDCITGLVFLATISATIIVIITVAPWNGYLSTTKTSRRIEDNASTSSCVDVAVIGGGVGGAYFGWKMRNKDMSIYVFEYSDRVGGRVFSKEFPAAPGTYLDFGSMRFKPSAHPIITKTAGELNLSIVPFDLGYGNADETVWYVRGKHLRNTDLGTDAVPYDLDAGEPKDPDSLIWKLLSENVNVSSNTYPGLEEMYNLHTKDGTPFYKISNDNFYGKHASHEAYSFLYDTGGWEDMVGTHGALHIPKMFTVFPGDSSSSGTFQTIAGGMEQFPKTLMSRFLSSSDSFKLHLNHQLMRIQHCKDGNYNLKFRKTKTEDGVTTPLKSEFNPCICAKKVVLAMPKPCVEAIDFESFRDNAEIMKMIDSVEDFPAGKIFLAYESQWWKTNSPDITHSKSDLQTRQTYDWATGTNNVSVILASYHDGPLTRYWRELSQFGTPIPGSLPGVNAVTDVIKTRIEQYLSKIYKVNQTDIPESVGGGMMLWDTFPFSSAWSYFKPGIDERHVLEKIRKPSPSHDVFLVGNSWAPGDLSGWIEGSLMAVDEVVEKYY